eukprot:2240211-Heterocapsa_arctica.AAC.1
MHQQLMPNGMKVGKMLSGYLIIGRSPGPTYPSARVTRFWSSSSVSVAVSDFLVALVPFLKRSGR